VCQEKKDMGGFPWEQGEKQLNTHLMDTRINWKIAPQQ